ncbi:MAG: c-type cytochrome [Bryobacteraceae bacterium]|jgi:putative heme-binding domain-containing protein
MKLTGPFVFLLAAFALPAQEGHGVTTADIQRGAQIFLTSCANCHGPNGDLIPGVNLASNRFRRAQTDSDLTDLVRKGIPGTPMPPGNYTDDQAFAIVAYVRSLASAPKTTGTAANALAGDPARGKVIVEGKGQCVACHRIAGAGGFAGPDLTSIGAARRSAELETKLLDPSANIRDANRPVRAVAKDGTAITGTLLNYDNYSLQMLDSEGRLRAFEIAKLKEYELMKTSPMPSCRDKLSAQEVADVVGYLGTLRGQAR